MERLQEKDFLACLEFLRRAYAARNLDEFAAAVLFGLPRVVHSELTGYNEYNPRRDRNRNVVDCPEAEPPGGIAVFNAFIHEHPIIRYYRESRDGRALKLSDFLTQNQYHRLGLYNEYFRHAYPPVEDLMAFLFHWRGQRVLAMALCRPRRNFAERDRVLLNLLRPHLMQAYLNVEGFEVHGLVNRALDELKEGVIVLGANLRVSWINRAAFRLLRAYFAARVRLGRSLPDELLRWVKQQVASLDAKDAVPTPCWPLVVGQGERRLIVRFIRRAIGYVLLVRERSTSVDPDLLKPLGLTRKECEVLVWVAQGKSDVEVAMIVGMGVRTVDKHLEHIYAKLGVENRTAAACRALDFLSVVQS